MTETPDQQQGGADEVPTDENLDVEGPNESNPNTPNANPQEQSAGDQAD